MFLDYYTQWKSMMTSGQDLAFWQEFYVKFYQAFIEADRWKQYLEGVGTILVVTAMALAIGIVLGVLVAMLRTAHDQQRPGHANPLLGVLNTLCTIYTTVIRGTPMMVQLLIMGLHIDSLSKQLHSRHAIQQAAPQGAHRLISHENHRTLRPPQIMFQVVADTPRLTHTGGRYDHLRLIIKVNCLRIL